MYSQDIRIPKERVAVLIGVCGMTKRRIQKKTNTQISVSKEGDILIEGEDSVAVFITSTIIKAVGRGFNPEIALSLIDERIACEIVDISPFCKKNPHHLKRIRARAIGTNGKARQMLESLTRTKISVYGKTVSIIGEVADVMVAKQAVEKLLQGAPHGNVYHFIERQHDVTTDRLHES